MTPVRLTVPTSARTPATVRVPDREAIARELRDAWDSLHEFIAEIETAQHTGQPMLPPTPLQVAWGECKEFVRSMDAAHRQGRALSDGTRADLAGRVAFMAANPPVRGYLLRRMDAWMSTAIRRALGDPVSAADAEDLDWYLEGLRREEEAMARERAEEDRKAAELARQAAEELARKAAPVAKHTEAEEELDDGEGEESGSGKPGGTTSKLRKPAVKAQAYDDAGGGRRGLRPPRPR